MYAVDCHAHTRFFHGARGRPTPVDPAGAAVLAAFARRRGLDGVAITNHDYRWVPDRGEPRTAAGDGAAGTPTGGDRGGPAPVAIPGVEVTTTRGHLLVIGPDPPARTEPGALTPTAAVDLAHERDCAAVLAHPFRDSTIRATDAPVDAVELNGKHPDDRGRVRRLADERDIPIVGGSDAHFPFEVGRAYTRIDAPALTPESVVAAIRDGRVAPALQRVPADRVLGPIYERVHRLKGHVEDSAAPIPVE